MADGVDDLLNNFNAIDRAIIDGAKNMRSLQASISKTNGVLTSKNWEIFSRFISGTGLWRITNRLKASVMFLNEMQNASERRRVTEAANLKSYAEIAKVAETAKNIQKDIVAIEQSTGKAREDGLKKLKDTSDIFGGLLFQYGDANVAMKKMGELMDRQLKDVEKLEKVASKSARRQKSSLIANSLTVKGATKLSDLMKKQAKHAKDIAGSGVDKIGKNISKVSEKAFGVDADELEKRFQKLGLDSSKDAKTKVTASGNIQRRVGGKLVTKEKYKEFEKLKQLQLTNNNIMKKSARVSGKFTKVLMTPITNIAKFTWRIAKGIGLVVKTMLMAAGYLLIVMLGLTILKQVFETNKEAFISGFNTLKEVFMLGMSIVQEGLGKAKDALEQIWAGFQDGKLMEVIYGVGNLIIAGLTVLGGLLVATFGAVIAGVGVFLQEVFNSNFNLALEEFGNVRAAIVGGVLKTISVVAQIVVGIALLAAVFFGLPALIVAGIAFIIWKVAEYLYQYSDVIASGIGTMIDTLSGLWESIRAIPGEIADAIPSASDVTGKVKDKLSFLPGLAEGGKISTGGLAIVGEKGPELVTLPAGAQVHSNSQSKAMASSVTNHITVQVTGRVGASDTEIRDIAQKVAREINTQMNRSSTSVVRF